MRFLSRFVPSLTAVAIVLAAAACSSEARIPSDPGEGGTSASAVSAVDSALGSGAASRIEIELPR
jgi:hypothetical protein